jgi:hypothetical protein
MRARRKPSHAGAQTVLDVQAIVPCTAHAAGDFLDLGLITGADKDAIVAAAGEWQRGKNK